jgi:hypothetical protein
VEAARSLAPVPQSLARNTLAVLASLVLGFVCCGLVIGLSSWVTPTLVILTLPVATFAMLPVSWIVIGLNDEVRRSWINARRLAFIVGWFAFIATVIVVLAPLV